MAETTGISWADHTFNPWIGCTKVSPACKHCYAERDFDHRYHKVQWGPSGTRILTTAANWRKPIKWNREAEQTGRRPRVFCASLADVFEDWEGPMRTASGVITTMGDDGRFIRNPDCPMGHRPATMDDARRQLFELIDQTPHLDWLLLTKRPENTLTMWPADPSACAGVPKPYRNVWLGTSIENQTLADARLPCLREAVEWGMVQTTFVSAEPMLGPIDLGENHGVDWVIAGGESGPNARPSHPEWFRSLRDQCKRSGVAFHFKQWGEWISKDDPSYTGQPFGDRFGLLNVDGGWFPQTADTNPGTHESAMVRIGTKQSGRLLDGQLHDAVPSVDTGTELVPVEEALANIRQAAGDGWADVEDVVSETRRIRRDMEGEIE